MINIWDKVEQYYTELSIENRFNQSESTTLFDF